MGKRSETRSETKKTPEVNSSGNRRGMNKASQENLTPIQPGQVLNPKGWPKGKRRAETLLAAGWEVFALKILDTVNAKRKSKKQKPITLEDSDIDPELEMWLKQMEKARNGDTKAFELIVAYGHGKPTQSLNVGGQPDNPILHEHEFEEVDAEVEEWLDGWFNPVKHTKVTTKKKHANSKTDRGAKQKGDQK
jgi:hypothetical protein